jgi:riboflavin kinase
MSLNLVSDMPRASPKPQYPSKSFYVKGKVFSGGGEGAKFIALPWVRKQIAEKLGFTPYSGTLNLKITEADVNLKKSLKNARSIEISPAEGFCRGKCFNAYFMNTLKCAIVIPEVENYPEDIIEVIAQVNLREKFKLKDGDVIEVKILI